MTYAVATTSERVRTDKSDHCACARMRDMRLDEAWTGRIWDHHSGKHFNPTSHTKAPSVLATSFILLGRFIVILTSLIHLSTVTQESGPPSTQFRRWYIPKGNVNRLGYCRLNVFVLTARFCGLCYFIYNYFNHSQGRS